MKETTRNLLVGTFVIGALVVLGILMMWFGEAPSFLGGSEWTLRITDVQELSGIADGSPVKLNGVDIGRVTSLDFVNPDQPSQGVVIVTRIKKIYSVPDGATAKVFAATLGFGSGHISIAFDSNRRSVPLDKEFAEIRGEMHSLIGELISSELVSSVEETIVHIGDLAAAAEPVANNLSIFLEQRTVDQVGAPGATERGMVANLSTVVERIDDMVENINVVLGDETVQEDVKAALTDMHDITQELRATVVLWKNESRRLSDNLNAGIDKTEINLDQSFARFNAVLDNLDDSTAGLARLTHGIERGEGTFGLLAKDARLYESAVLALDRFSDLVASVQRITTKIEDDGYIKIGQETAVGTFTKKFPLGGETASAN